MGAVLAYLAAFPKEPMDLVSARFKMYAKQAQHVFKVLRIDPIAQRDFFDFFHHLDTDQSGEIEYYEFLDRLNLKETKLMERLC